MARSPRGIGTRWDGGFRQVIARATVWAFGVFGAIGVYLVVASPSWRHLYEIESTIGFLGVSGALVLACLGARDGGPPGRVRGAALTIGAAFAVIGWISIVPAFWDHLLFRSLGSFRNGTYSYGAMNSIREVLERTSTVAYGVSAIVAVNGILGFLGVKGWALRFRRMAGVTGTVYGCCALSTAVVRIHPAWVDTVQSGAAVSTITLLGMLSVVWATHPSVRMGRHDAGTGEATATLACPSCAMPQVFVLGRRVECRSCSLGLTIRLDAPRCECGYSVKGLTTPVCPECGAEIPKRHAWALGGPGSPTQTVDSASDLPASSSTRSA